MIRSFDELYDILIDPTNVIDHNDREDIRTHSNSIVSSNGDIDDQEASERVDNNSNYDEDFEEESPTKEAAAEYIEEYESDHTSISYQSLPENQSFNNLPISLPLAPSPPKKSEFLDESTSSANESAILSPRAVRILKTDNERLSSPSSQNNDGNFINKSSPLKEDEFSRPEISDPADYTHRNSLGSPPPTHAVSVVTIGKSRFSRPKLFSRVSVVTPSNPLQTAPPTLLTTPSVIETATENRNEIKEIVRNVLHEDKLKKLYAEELLVELQRRNAIPNPVPDVGRSKPSSIVESPAIRIPNYDRYYEICIEIQELVQRECEKEAQQRRRLSVEVRDDGVRSARRLRMDAMALKGASRNADCQTSEQADTSLRSSKTSDTTHDQHHHHHHEEAAVSSHRLTSKPPFKVGKVNLSPKESPSSSGSVKFKGGGEPAPRQNSLSSLRNGTPPKPSPSSARVDRSLSAKIAAKFSENSNRKRSTVSSLPFSSNTMPYSTTSSSSTSPSSPSPSSSSCAPSASQGFHDDGNENARSIDEFLDMMDKLRREQPKIFDACNSIYSTFLSDLIGTTILFLASTYYMHMIIILNSTDVCKRRVHGSSVEELAMHRKLSEFVTTAFASKSMQSIMAGMMHAAVEVAPPFKTHADRKPIRNNLYTDMQY